MADNIEIVLGDIADIEADAIVNAANTDLIMGGGVAGALRRRGGPSIQAECDRLGPIKKGEAVITGAGSLKAKYVIHAASMSLGGGATADTIRDAVKNSFTRAEENGVHTIAIPALGAGVAGFPLRPAAEIMMDETVRALKRGAVEKVIFVLCDKAAYDAFTDAYESAVG